MATLEVIEAALDVLSLDHGTGVFKGSPTLDHYVLVPNYDRGYQADNDDLYVDVYVNIEFYIEGDYRATIALARARLKEADIVVEDGQYVEYEKETKKHHYALSVIGRE